MLDYRYGRDEMRAIFGADAYLRALLEVEAILAEEQEALGLIPKGHGTAIRKAIPKVSKKSSDFRAARRWHALVV